MKRFLLAATLAVLAAAFYFLGTPSGAGSMVRWATSHFLSVPLEFNRIQPTGMARFELDDAALRFPGSVVTSLSARISVRWRRVDCQFRNVRVRAATGWLQKLTFAFDEGRVRISFRNGVTELRFSDWTSPVLRVGGDALVDRGGNLTRLEAKGEANLKLLGALLSRDSGGETGASQTTLVPFEVRYESEKLEVVVQGKTWLRSSWTMRR